MTEEYILTCPVADTPMNAENGVYHATFLATGGANGAPNATSGTWTLKVAQPAPSWATSGSTDGNYFSAIKGVPFCYDLEVSAGQVGPSGTNPGSTGSLPLTSLTAGTTPANVSNYSIQDVNLAAGTAQICGTNNNAVASAPVTMAPVATNSAGTATDSIPLWSQNECTWTSSGGHGVHVRHQSGPRAVRLAVGLRPAHHQRGDGGTTLDEPTCPGGVGVSASGGLGDAWTMNTANPLPDADRLQPVGRPRRSALVQPGPGQCHRRARWGAATEPLTSWPRPAPRPSGTLDSVDDPAQHLGQRWRLRLRQPRVELGRWEHGHAGSARADR